MSSYYYVLKGYFVGLTATLLYQDYKKPNISQHVKVYAIVIVNRFISSDIFMFPINVDMFPM